MGCGKSSTGHPLAKALGYRYVDADSVLEELLGKSIEQIFDEEGEESFRSMEAQILQSIGERHSLIVSTGGGVVTRSENWGILHQGIVVWLDVELGKLWLRLQEDSVHRPLLKAIHSEADLERFLNQRKCFYSEADLSIQIRDEGPEEVVSKILKALPSLITDPLDPGEQQTTAT